jgi:hypothetical protein
LSGNKPSAHRAGQSDDPWRPSLFLDVDHLEERLPGAQRPFRMLSALQGGASLRPRKKSRGAFGGKSWLWTTVLALLAASGFFITIYVSATDSSDAPTSDSALTSLAASPMTWLPSATPEAFPPAAAAALSTSPPSPPDMAASPAVAAPEPSGPAKLEIRNDGLAALPGMAAAAEAVAAERAGAASDVAMTAAASSPAAPLSAVSTDAAHTSETSTAADSAAQSPSAKTVIAKSSIVVAKSAAPGARHVAKPPAQATPRRQPATNGATPSDPDAELVAAIMARMEGSHGANDRMATASSERSHTIAALVRDCNALPDSGSALACRRRICDGYWGKAQACPRSMAPQAAATVTTSSGAN